MWQVIPYEDFRTGLTFDAVREILTHEQNVQREAGQYMFVSRSTVLGRWCEMKRSMYSRYLRHTEEHINELKTQREQHLKLISYPRWSS